MDQNQPLPARHGSSTSLAKPPPTPKLPTAPAPGLDDGMVSEPSLILDGLPESKRRRVGEPGEAAAAGPVLTVLDPRCNRSDLELVLEARKAELRVLARTRLLVVATAATPVLRKLWNKHRARVVDPEHNIQSIVRCALQF
ncbi:hypothetical protein H4R19_000570 [Coemansia spiralis]|nr:hypothetical protein H4R19_000570 [Coemansia spiralis]